MIKTDFRYISENREFKQKNKAKSSEGNNFATFYRKNIILIEKRQTLINFLL